LFVKKSKKGYGLKQSCQGENEGSVL